MPKIIFIEPKAPNLHIFSRFPMPRLGGVLLGTLAKQRGWNTEVIFEEISSLNRYNLPEADVVGISSITSTAMRAYEIADAYRLRGIPVLMGGPHVTFMPNEAMNHSDFVITGEGEIPFSSFMEAFERGAGWDEIPNFSYRYGDDIFHNPHSVAAPVLKNLPFPDLSLVRMFKRPLRKRLVPVETSRGCPFDCEFCSVNRLFGRKMRFRPIDETVEELKKYANRRNMIFFVDDNFTARPERTKRLLEAVLKADVRIAWTAQVRTDAAKDKELLHLMKRSGCRAVQIGIESINPDTLNNMKKKQTVEISSEAIRAFHKSRIRVHGMFVLGFDEDDIAATRQTVRFAKGMNLNSAQFMVLTPLPGTPIFESMQNDRRLLTKEWSLYDAHHVVFKPQSILPFDLQRMQIEAHKRFYSLTQQIRRLFRFEFSELAIAVHATKLNNHWKRINRLFMRGLKCLSKSTPIINRIRKHR